MATFTVDEKITAAKIGLQRDHPFHCYLLMCMPMRVREQLSTVCITTEPAIYYNPKFMEQMSIRQIKGTFIHEIEHFVRQHLRRRGERDGELSNIAEDMCINDCIEWDNQTSGRSGDLELPCGIRTDRYHTWKGPIDQKTGKPVVIENVHEKCFEAIYDELKKHCKGGKKMTVVLKMGGGGGKGKGDPQDGDGDGEGEGKGMEVEGLDDHKARGDIEKEQRAENGGKDPKSGVGENGELDKNWKQHIAEAAHIAKQRGRLPGHIERMLNELLTPKVNWRERLVRFMTNLLPFDFGWSRPHKKSFSIGVYLPEIKKENIEVVVHIDTSGSVWDKAPDFMAEVGGVLCSFEHVKATLIFCDDGIQGVHELNSLNIDELLTCKPKGCGGTSHGPVVKYINQNLPDTKIFITLTDGYSDMEEWLPKLPENCHKLIALSEKRDFDVKFEHLGEVLWIDE